MRRNPADRLGRRLGPERDLDDRKATRKQGVAGALSLVRVESRQHGHDAELSNAVERATHRASHPPSTGRTTPLT